MENKQSNMYSYFWLTLYIFKLLSTIFIIIAITIFIITVIANISNIAEYFISKGRPVERNQ